MCLSHVCTVLQNVFYGRTQLTKLSTTQAQGELGDLGVRLEN